MTLKPAILLCATLLFASAAVAQSGSEAKRCAKGTGDAAIAACSGVIGTGEDKTLGWAYFDRGRDYFASGLYGSAIADLSDALRLKYNEAAALELRGRALLAVGNYPDAIHDFGRLTDLRPKSETGFRLRCLARAVSGRDLDDAVADCGKALALKPGGAATLEARCLANYRNAKYPAAIADCSAALNADPVLAPALYLRGSAKLKTKDTAGGDADIAAAKSLDDNIASDYDDYGVKP